MLFALEHIITLCILFWSYLSFCSYSLQHFCFSIFSIFDYHYIHILLYEQDRMRLKGQMIYVPETDLVLFLCSPSVLNLDDLNRRGLFLSDIPLHDSTRDLILLSEQFEAEYKLTKNLEILTDKLQQTYRELEDEKRKTDR